MKQAKPILHGRDHGPGGSDGIPSTGVTDGSPLVADTTSGYTRWGTPSAGGGMNSFALVGITGTISDSDAYVLDLDLVGTALHWGGDTAGSSFDYDATPGHARILEPGFYQLVLFVEVEIDGSPVSDTSFQIDVEVAGDLGYGLEPPPHGQTPSSPMWKVTFPAGTSDSFEASLQRIRPISVTSSTTFPLDILPTLYTDNPGSELVNARWMALWGFRISDPPGSYMSD